MGKAADYTDDPDYQAFVDLWQREQRAPLVFVDWLLDRGLETQAEAVRWAHNTLVNLDVDYPNSLGKSYICPKKTDYKCNHYFWYKQLPQWEQKWSDSLPPLVYNVTYGPDILNSYQRGSTFITCITDLLDNWYLGAENDY